MTAVLSIVGRKGSGKAEVLETLISLLSQRGLRVGVIKHLAKDDLEIDEPGKDTYRYRMQGAQTVMLAGRKGLAVFSNLEEEISIENLLVFFPNFDLIFLEGYFLDEAPKIEVYKKELGDLLLTERARNVFAICSEEGTRRQVPHFSFTQLDLLGALIEDQILSKEVGIS